MDREVCISDRESGIEDVQSRTDSRGLAIQAVGIRGLRLPLAFEDAGEIQQTVAVARLGVELPAERRGTHMSRLVALLEERREPLSAQRLPGFLSATAARLRSHAVEAEFVFPYFFEKIAPVSQTPSRTDCSVALQGRLAAGRVAIRVDVSVPVTTLCPCSKQIARYGAHSQRSCVTVGVETRSAVTLRELIALIEEQASAPVYALLKRPDEKYLTERAYENPRFAEDLVRDVASRLDADPRVAGFTVDVENFESIHNHSAYARIERRG